MSRKLNFKHLASLALAQAENVVNHFAPGGKLVNREYVVRNPNRNDTNAGSFSVNVDTGIWAEFSSDDKGNDLVGYVAYVQRLSQGDAYKSLAHFLGVSDEPLGDVKHTNTATPAPPKVNKEPTFIPIYPPPPEAAKSCPSSFMQYGKATQYWDYKSASGVLLMRVCRFDRTTSSGERAKDYRPVCYGKGKAKNIDRTGWHFRQLPNNRPLYGLDVLAKMAVSAPVIMVEGEKSSDASRLLFPSRPCVTWSGGSKAISKTDFSPLAGREVWYWPDNDDAGTKSIEALRTALTAIGVSAYRVFDLTVFNRFAPGKDGKLIEAASVWPEKSDAFDAVQLGWTAQHIAALESRGALLAPLEQETPPAIPTPTPTTETPASETPSAVVFGFKVDDNGVWIYDAKAEKYRCICARLEVIALSRDGNGSGKNWGLLVRFKDYDGVEKVWNIPMKLFATDGGSEVVRGLLDRGLNIDSHRESKRKVLDYLQASQSKERVALVYKMGWHKDVFVMPESTVGNSSERILFYTEGATLCKLAARGTLEQWQENVSKYCVGNALAVFAMSAAFSAPLVEILGQEIMGFHFYGDSSWGKTTLLHLACSAYGDPDDYKKTWRSTSTGLEGTAAAHSDMLLGLDEINQVDARIIDEVVYMLGNGSGRVRGNQFGGARESLQRWLFTFLSNGERTLEQYLAEAGKTKTGGLEMRFVGIRATPHESEHDAMRMGVFNHSHDFAGGAALSEHLKGTMAQYHGTAFPAFLNALVRELEGDKRTVFIAKCLESLSNFKNKYLSANAGGQVARAANKFALVSLAGELATRWQITGWMQGQARAAAVTCFSSWLRARGGEGNLEDKQMLDHVRHQITKYGESRFKRWDDPEDSENAVVDSHVPITPECWGYRREVIDKNILEGNSSDVVFHIFPDAFSKDLCKGFDAGRVARLLRDLGALELTDSDKREKRLVTKVRLPRMGKRAVPVYKIRNSALFGGDDDTEEEVKQVSGF